MYSDKLAKVWRRANKPGSDQTSSVIREGLDGYKKVRKEGGELCLTGIGRDSRLASAGGNSVCGTGGTDWLRSTLKPSCEQAKYRKPPKCWQSAARVEVKASG